VEGVYRFLGRVWRLFVDEASETEFEQAETAAASGDRDRLLGLIRLSPAIQPVPSTTVQRKVVHACIKKVTEDLDGMRFNTAISAMMVFVNEAMTWEIQPAEALRNFLILLQPFAPHLAEELWARLNAAHPSGSELPLAYQPWPVFNPDYLVEQQLEIAVQVNGKLRDVVTVPNGAGPKELEEAALKSEKIQALLQGKTPKKIIVVPGRLVNIIL
jgi:leucyl-tRNA synthetase